MAYRNEGKRDEKGLSARYLILVFLMGVAACAVFFSLGFLVGYSERSADKMSAAEEVTPTGVIPPTVNPPLEGSSAPAGDQPRATSTEPPTERAAPTTPASKGSAERAAAPKPAAKPPAPATSDRTASSGREKPVTAGYTVQVAALNEKQDAEKLVKELRARGFGVFVVTPEFSDAKDDLYRVQVGPYATREEAVRIRDRIAKEGFKPFIRQ